jgi:ABC-type antimicrobial peptide transport system permease subunit
MFDFISNLIIKIIPSNWYEVKKQCDIITTICNTIISIKWYAWWCVTVIVVSIATAFCFWCYYKIKKLKEVK